ncbi:MAG: response regulator [Cyanobacteria bacterium P01_D01_bin.56]
MSTSPITSLNKKIKQARKSLYTGLLAIGTEADSTVPWVLYFLMGQMVWADSRTHPKRRWQRQFLKYSPEVKSQGYGNHGVPNYKTVARLVMHQKFDPEHFSQIVRGCITEVLFDIIYTASTTSSTSLIYKASPRKGADFPCIALQQTDMWKQAQQTWHAWQGANLLDCCPNLAPTVVQPFALQEATTPDIFKILTRLADGQQTLRDLAVRTEHPLIPLTQSLVPHIRRNLIKLICVDDLSNNGRTAQYPSFSSTANGQDLSGTNAKPDHFRPGVVYVTGSVHDAQTMGDIFLQSSDYRYSAITEPTQALPQLLKDPPHLIFLDLVMPVVNGYELCIQIRRIIEFNNVPVILIANSNSLPDRVRAKFVGATGFMSHPIKASQVLPMVIKYLQLEVLEPFETDTEKSESA